MEFTTGDDWDAHMMRNHGNAIVWPVIGPSFGRSTVTHPTVCFGASNLDTEEGVETEEEADDTGNEPITVQDTLDQTNATLTASQNNESVEEGKAQEGNKNQNEDENGTHHLRSDCLAAHSDLDYVAEDDLTYNAWR
jgi:hypothetical protein